MAGSSATLGSKCKAPPEFCKAPPSSKAATASEPPHKATLVRRLCDFATSPPPCADGSGAPPGDFQCIAPPPGDFQPRGEGKAPTASKAYSSCGVRASPGKVVLEFWASPGKAPPLKPASKSIIDGSLLLAFAKKRCRPRSASDVAAVVNYRARVAAGGGDPHALLELPSGRAKLLMIEDEPQGVQAQPMGVCGMSDDRLHMPSASRSASEEEIASQASFVACTIAIAEKRRQLLGKVPADKQDVCELARLMDDTAVLQPCEVPRFDERAHGTPLEWNSTKQLFWGRKVKNYPCFKPVTGASLGESFSRVREFLRLRPGSDGLPVLDNLIDLNEDNTGWYRFAWKPFQDAGGVSALPKTSPGPHNGGRSDWQRAWHGCKFEALYSIMYHGRLFSSCDEDRGDRFFGRAPGVYVHKDGTCKKTANYFRFVPLCQDGFFWAALWEVMVDRADRVPVANTDQWVQHERSVRLAALWLVGCAYANTQEGWEVTEAWDPLLEAHPEKRLPAKSA